MFSSMPPPVTDSENKLYSIAFDERLRLIRLTITGFWTMADAEEHVSRIIPFFDASRKYLGHVRLLVDRRGAVVQGPEALGVLAANNARLRPEDRVAIVITAGLLRLQFKRTMTHIGASVVATEEEALAWLDAAERTDT